MSKPIGYIVMESCDDYEQGLRLSLGPALPKGGILNWLDRNTNQPVAVFETRASARAAIERTEHYRKAFDSSHPERKNCRITPVVFAETLEGSKA